MVWNHLIFIKIWPQQHLQQRGLGGDPWEEGKFTLRDKQRIRVCLKKLNVVRAVGPDGMHLLVLRVGWCHCETMLRCDENVMTTGGDSQRQGESKCHSHYQEGPPPQKKNLKISGESLAHRSQLHPWIGSGAGSMSWTGIAFSTKYKKMDLRKENHA